MPIENANLGRLVLYTDYEDINRQNIEEVVSLAWTQHQKNVQRINWLFDYEKGDQPINERIKPIRSDHNTKVCVNKASQIVDFHTGYLLSNPITYVQRARVEDGKTEADGKADDTKVALFNKMCIEQGMAAKNIELAINLFTCGVAYKMALPMRAKKRRGRQKPFSSFEIAIPAPATTFVVYSNDAYRERMLGCTYSILSDGTIRLTAYTEDLCYTLKADKASDIPTMPTHFTLVGEVTPNALGFIPIVEYSLKDRAAVFEKVIPIMDALNILDSDRVNDVTQHVQSLLWMHNCIVDKDQKEKIKNGDGLIVTKSAGDGHEAKISYLTQTLNQSEQQTFVDHLIDELEQITSTPNWNESRGGSTTGAMQLSNGWQCAELYAGQVEQRWDASEQEFIKICIECIKADNREEVRAVKDLELADMEVRFCRKKTYDLVSKVNALVSLINVGVDGLTAFNTVSLFTDSQQAWLDSAKTINRLQAAIGQTQTSNDWNANKDENGNGGAENTERDKTEESVQPSKVTGVDVAS